jgi:hypothetical protein
MKLIVTVSDETKRILEDLADQDGIEPAKRIHKWLRGFAFEPQFQGGSSLASLSSALTQRGTMHVGNNMTFTSDELNSGAGRMKFPDGVAEDYKPGPNEIEVVFGQRLEDVLPKCLSYLDLGSTADQRRLRGWSDMKSFVSFIVAGKAAEDYSKDMAREAEEEENTLYTSDKKKSKKAEAKKDN